MRRAREYLRAADIDPDSLEINLQGVADHSSRNEARTLEVIDLVVQIIELASKPGRVRNCKEEVFDEAA